MCSSRLVKSILKSKKGKNKMQMIFYYTVFCLSLSCPIKTSQCVWSASTTTLDLTFQMEVIPDINR